MDSLDLLKRQEAEIPAALDPCDSISPPPPPPSADRQSLQKRQRAELQASVDRGEPASRLEASHQRETQSLLQKQQAELTRCDMKIVTQLDQKVGADGEGLER